jgi:hypothetical protein
MKLDINKIELKELTENIYQILYEGKSLKFWSSAILIPFGLEYEYNKQILKAELDESENNKCKNEHIHLKKLILHIEKLIKDKINMNNDNNNNDNVIDQFKSIIKKRYNKPDMVECRIKKMKNNIITSIEYEDKEHNYLKTIYDLPKQSYVKIQFEINGLFDYRNNENENEKNKFGLIVYATKIIVLK